MGNWDEYCIICGGPIENQFEKDNILESYKNNVNYKVKKTIKEYKWLSKLYLITNENKIIKTTDDNYTGNGSFMINGKEYIITSINFFEKKNTLRGICCHVDCYKLLQQEFDYKLNYHDVYSMLRKTYNLLKKHYGIVEKYTGHQFYSHIEVHLHDKYLLESPLKNEKNAKRIIKYWKPLIIKFKNNSRQ
jgi:hypothetical protein